MSESSIILDGIKLIKTIDSMGIEIYKIEYKGIWRYVSKYTRLDSLFEELAELKRMDEKSEI